jgi:hypothetical protein
MPYNMPEEKSIRRMYNPQNSSHQRGKNFLLVIGIDKYIDPEVPRLNNAVRDTKRLTQILTESYGFELFGESLHDEKATRTSILESIEKLEKELTVDDNLIVIFSGHGFRKSESGFIVPVDGKNDSTANYIDFASLKDRVNELKMHHFLFILDCCFAGVALKNLGEKRELGKPSRRILAASSSDETAEDGFSGKNSPFTFALAEILEDNKSIELPVKNLYVKVREFMDGTNTRQVPVEGSWKMPSNRDGEFIFMKKNVEEDAWAAVDKNNKLDVHAFIETYPLSKFTAEAQDLILNIEVQEAEAIRLAEEKRKADIERQAYERAKAHPTVFNLSKFLRTYPLSIYTEKIVAQLAKVEEEDAWRDAKTKNTLSGYLSFVRSYPQGGFAEEANIHIEAISKALEEDKINEEAAIKVQREAKVAADKLNELEELERQKQIAVKHLFEKEEAERLEKERFRQEKLRIAKQQQFEKEERESLERENLSKLKKEKDEKERLERIRQSELAKKTADLKAQPAPLAQAINYQNDEPTFFQKFKIPLISGGLTLFGLIIWLAMPKSQTPPDVQKTDLVSNVSNDETAYAQAIQANTIPALENFVKNNPSSKRITDADNALKVLKEELAVLLANITVLQSEVETKQNAKVELEKAKRIDPTNADVIKWAKQLK